MDIFILTNFCTYKLQVQFKMPFSLGIINYCSNSDIELSGLSGKSVLVKIIKVLVLEGGLGRDPLTGVIHQALLQQVQGHGTAILHGG